MDRGAWWGRWGCKESVRTKRLSTTQGQQTFFLGSHAYQFPSDSHLPFCALKETVMIRRITSVQFSSFTVILAYIHQSVVSLVTITQHLLGDLDQLRTQGQPGVHSHAELRVRLYIAHGLSIKVLPPWIFSLIPHHIFFFSFFLSFLTWNQDISIKCRFCSWLKKFLSYMR